ncbi:MAG: tRNA pseudouridine(13) synthase TruD [Nitrososphaerales archaeon]
MIAVPEAERAIGIETYASTGAPCKALARSSEEDFRVEEFVPKLEITSEDRPDYYPLYRVEKRSIDTLHMEKSLSEALRSRLSYGGMKDKRAVAVQYATPTSTKSLRPTRVVRERFTAQLVGFIPRPLSRGMIRGNRFTIVLRECCAEMPIRVEEAFALASARRLPSFFGFQRFGAREVGTHLVGRALVRQEFEEAVSLMLFRPRTTDDEATRAAKNAMADGRYAEGAKMLPVHQDVERMVARRLSSEPEDWTGALRAVPMKLRRLYVQAYQSFIFNRTLSLALLKGLDISTYEPGDNWSEASEDGLATSPVHGVKERAPPSAAPMVQLAGFAYRNYGSRFDSCLEEVMTQERVSAKEFYVKQMQEVSAEGGFRRPHLAVGDPSYSCAGDRTDLSFTLARGQYATVLLREVIKPADSVVAGLA